MSSKKEEERNEKIIRGLMKLPPNRRCINCNSLGPQYVCTNFWTFVCTTCSGIHREFTHRVKSVSMAKFTSQEVEALQKGGNQRAREIFLKDWDPQRQRFPDSSNADKVREFIKNVYVGRRYAGAQTSNRPQRDMQNLRNHEDETRRASSYHSYSQSPPYDFQYEERHYRKHAPVLTRKPGSDRGLYEGKTSSFLSPSHLSNHMYEDRFVNEGSNPRFSDYSVSGGGDPFRPSVQSPNFQRDIGFSSSSSETSRDILGDDVRHHTVNTFSDTNGRRNGDRVPCPQRTASSGSFGSFDSNSMSFKSVNSVSFVDVVAEPEQSVGTEHNEVSTFPSLPRSSVSGNSDGLDLFNAPFVSQSATSIASEVDLFKLAETSSTSSVDLLHSSPLSLSPTLNSHQPLQTSPSSSVDLFCEMPQQHSVANLNGTSADVIMLRNEGWATFDVPQLVESNFCTMNSTPTTFPSDDGSLGKLNPLLSLNASLQLPSFQDCSAHGPSSLIPNLWHENLHNNEASLNETNTQSWNAFEDSIEHLPIQTIQLSSEQVVAYNSSSVADLYLGSGFSELLQDFSKDGIQRAVLDTGPCISSIPSYVSRSSYDSSVFPVTAGAHSHAADRKSNNPFDLPYDSDSESSNMFMDMSSLQAALPNGLLPTSFIDESWFPQNSVTPYIPAGSQGTSVLMAGQTPSTQLQNGPTQGPVASIGGNPFA